MLTSQVKRGDIYYADLSGCQGSEQGGIRPVLIVQNNVENKYSPTIIVAPITAQINKAKLPTHIEIEPHESGLLKNSVVMFEQVRTLDKKRLRQHVGCLDEEKMIGVDYAIVISFGINSLSLANRVILICNKRYTNNPIPTGNALYADSVIF